MIIANQFPTDITYAFDNLKVTKIIESIPIETENLPDAYWLGYISYDDLPSPYGTSSANVEPYIASDGTIQAKITFTPDNPDNVDFGYVLTTNATVTEQITVYDYQSSKGKWDYNNNMYNQYSRASRFINSGAINGFGGNQSQGGTSSINIRYWFRYEIGEDTTIHNNDGIVEFQLGGFKDTVDYLSGNKTFPIEINMSYGTIKTQLNVSYLNEHGYQPLGTDEVIFSSNYSNYNFREGFIIIANYLNNPGWLSSSDGSSVPIVAALPMVKYNTPIGERLLVSTGGNTSFVGNESDIKKQDWWNSNFNGNYNNCYRRLYGTIDTASFPPATGLQRYWWAHPSEDGNFMIRFGTNNFTLTFQLMYKPKELLFMIAMYPRRIDRANYPDAPGFGFGKGVYYPLFAEDNKLTGEMIDGELNDIRAKLKPWQIYDLQDNTYSDVDRPPYEPPSPGDEGEESGDRIGNLNRGFTGAYNFITQYAMTREQLGQFGNLLWTSWADSEGKLTDMWRNFKMFISADPASDTGSIDIASVMDFIVSLQVFPFDLTQFLFIDAPNVCIGAGQYPLPVSARKLITINHVMDCGTVTIPRPYGDFRDYENMSISAYLPYCGTVELNPGDVIGRNVNINYSIDTLSGSCTAVLTAYDDGGYLYNVGMINGQISASIPVTATNSGQIRAQRIADVSSLAGLAGNFFVNNISRGANSGISAKNVEPISAISGMAYGTASDTINMGTTLASTFAERFSRSAIACPTLAGGNGIAAFYQPACPYIQMRYGIYQYPANYKHSVGGVSSQSSKLSSYKGFTVCENVDTSGLTCHNDEKAAIKAALSAGVYL